MAEAPAIRVKFPDDSVISLDLSARPWSWSADGGPQAELYAGLAGCVDYRYSVADGEPGHLFAQEVAKQLGGEAELPPVPPGEGDIY